MKREGCGIRAPSRLPVGEEPGSCGFHAADLTIPGDAYDLAILQFRRASGHDSLLSHVILVCQGVFESSNAPGFRRRERRKLPMKNFAFVYFSCVPAKSRSPRSSINDVAARNNEKLICTKKY